VVRVVKRKLYVVNVPSSIPIDKIYEKISSAVRSSYAEVRIQHGKAYIELVGTASQIKESWSRIREVVRELWELQNLLEGRETSIEAIAKEAGRTFPPEALAYALKLRGYESRLSEEKDKLLTNAPAEEVIALARQIAETIDSIRFMVKGTAARRLIAAVSVGLNVPAERVIEYSVKAKILEETEDGLRLREEWRRAVRKLAVLLKGASLDAEEVEGERSV